MISVAIVEDDPSDAQLLRECVDRYGDENGIGFEIVSFSDAVTFLDAYRPIYDVIFMDIQMPYCDGLRAAKKLRELDETVLLVFVTTLEQYAIKGYEVSALDYIIKPVSYRAMSIKLRRILRSVEQADKDQIVLTFATESLRVKIADICRVEAVEHVITVHFRDGTQFKTRKSLSALETELSPAPHCFIRVNNYTLINPRYVTHMTGQELLVGGETVPISRARKKQVAEKLTEYMGRR